MDHLKADIDPQRNKQSNWLTLSLRLMGGAILGYLISFLLFMLSETGNLSLLGWIFFGQEETLEIAFFYAFYDKWHSMTLSQVDNAALLVYTSLWAFITALLVSGRRKLIRLGVIFLILYVVTGCLSYLILMTVRVPT
jgi:hypothetical protein